MCNFVTSFATHPSQQKQFSLQQSGTMTPLWNSINEEPFDIKYIYLGSIYPKTIKGPYRHTIRSGYLYLLTGEILLTHQIRDGFCEDYLLPGKRIYLNNGTGYCLIGLGCSVSTFLNICDHPWQPGDRETEVPDFSSYDFKQWGIA